MQLRAIQFTAGVNRNKDYLHGEKTAHPRYARSDNSILNAPRAGSTLKKYNPTADTTAQSQISGCVFFFEKQSHNGNKHYINGGMNPALPTESPFVMPNCCKFEAMQSMMPKRMPPTSSFFDCFFHELPGLNQSPSCSLLFLLQIGRISE